MPTPVEDLIAGMNWATELGLSELTFTTGDSRVTILREATAEAAPGPPPIARDDAAPSFSSPDCAPDAVTAPLAGLCHLAPEAGGAPFVSPGQTVEQGQTLCMIEAMKVMSCVIAPFDGTVEAILVEDGASVGACTPLVRLSG